MPSCGRRSSRSRRSSRLASARDASFYALSALPTQTSGVGALANPGMAPVLAGSSSATLISSEATEALTLQPNAAERYAQSLLVGYSDA